MATGSRSLKYVPLSYQIQTVYWLVVGALLGFGFISMLSIGLPFVLLGLVLLGVGGRKFSFCNAWPALITLGLVPSLLLAWSLLAALPPCNGPLSPGQGCAQMPPSYGSMALVFLAIAVTGALAPALRGHRRLEMSAAVAAGVAVIAWSARHALSAAQVGQGCRSSSGAALHCYPIMSASPWSQGDYAGVALSFTLGIVVAALMVTAAYLHAYRGRRDMLVVLWIAAGSLLFIGLPSGEVLPALPGLFAVVSGLAGVGLFSSDDQLAEASATT